MEEKYGRGEITHNLALVSLFSQCMSLKPMYAYIVLLLPSVSLCGLVVFYLLLYVQPIHYLALQLYFRTVNYISDISIRVGSHVLS